MKTIMFAVYTTMTLAIAACLQGIIWADAGIMNGMLKLPGVPNLMTNVSITLLCLLVAVIALFWAYLAGFAEIIKKEHKTRTEGGESIPIPKWHQIFIGIGVIKESDTRSSPRGNNIWPGGAAYVTIVSFLLNRASQACGIIMFAIAACIIPAWTLPLVCLGALVPTFYKVSDSMKDIALPFSRFLRTKFLNYLTNVGVAAGTVAGLYITAITAATSTDRDCMRIHVKFPEGATQRLLSVQEADILLKKVPYTPDVVDNCLIWKMGNEDGTG